MNKTELKLNGMDDYFSQEAFNVLRTNVQFCGQDVKVIMVTSCTMNEGKSYISMHLAHTLSELGKRVLVIDADMRKSVMAGRNSSTRNVKGLSEVITGQGTLNECVYLTQYENLHVMFAGKYPPNPVELLNSTHFDSLLKSARKAYDYIIVDTPPLGMVIDAAVIATQCDGAILVIGSSHVKYPQAQEVIAQLKKANCNVLGAVLNNAEKKKRGYYRYKQGYGYRYRYYGKYGHYGNNTNTENN